MKHIYKIVTISLLAALLLSACSKRHNTHDTTDQNTQICFSAQSHATTTKASITPLNTDFGIWGIARFTGTEPYILWPNKELPLVRVVKNSSGNHEPIESAYWMAGYDYNFLALAPWEIVDEIRELNAVPDTDGSEDALVFEYDMGANYRDFEYDIDLLGAVANNVANADRDKAQPLFFWHLFSAIRVKVIFAGLEGTLDKISLVNIRSKGVYTLTFNDSKDISISCQLDESENETLSTAILDTAEDDQGKQYSYKLFHILPQNIDNVDLYLDFTVIKEGQEIKTSNFKVNLANAKSDPSSTDPEVQSRGYYAYNEWHNWNITIAPKTIDFDVSVTEWAQGETFDDFIIK